MTFAGLAAAVCAGNGWLFCESREPRPSVTNKLRRIADRAHGPDESCPVGPTTQIVQHPGRLVQFSRLHAGMSGCRWYGRAGGQHTMLPARTRSVLQPPPYAVIAEPDVPLTSHPCTLDRQ